MSKEVIRKNTHAGSWYVDSPDVLNKQLSDWLQKAGSSVHGPARVIIVPHAGYVYCGACAAHSYKEINPENIKRVFILGPSHHMVLDGCALTLANKYQTPLYDLEIDDQMNKELLKTKMFGQMDMQTDEDEHSIEMCLPYVAKRMTGYQFKIVPVLVGSLNNSRDEKYGEIFSQLLANSENLFVISSDFCHWGSRFHYQHHERNWGAIHESIEKLDRMGMDAIETCDPKEFKRYLQKYGNTICGRNPILLILNAIQKLSNTTNFEFKFKFLNYAQSSKCRSHQDSSVSYAAASLIIEQ